MKAAALVISDVDGTLVAPGRRVSTSVRDAVERLIANSVDVAFASGRPLVSLRRFRDSLCPSARLIASNGNVLELTPSCRISLRHFTAATVASCLEISAEHGAAAICHMADDCNYSVAVDDRTLAVLLIYGETPPIRVSARYLVEHHVRIVHIHLVRPMGWSARVAIANATVARSVAEFVTVTPLGVDKGVGVVRLREELGYTKLPVFILGDADNDISMLRLPDVTSISVGEPALDTDYVAPSVEANGFSWAVDNVILQNSTNARTKHD